jgi:uroporphyrinogen-III decarboxylase
VVPSAASEKAAAAHKLLTGFMESPFMEANKMVHRSRWLIDETYAELIL